VVRHREIKTEKADERAAQTFGLAQREVEHRPERQRRQNRPSLVSRYKLMGNIRSVRPQDHLSGELPTLKSLIPPDLCCLSPSRHATASTRLDRQHKDATEQYARPAHQRDGQVPCSSRK
jgi:hypothetical protein